MTKPIPTWRETLGNSPTLVAAGAVGQAMQQEIDALRTENERMTKQCKDFAASEYKTKVEAQTTFDALRTRLAEVEKDAADMFWNNDDAEKPYGSIDEFLNDEICNGLPVEVGAIYTIQRAVALPKIQIRVTSVDDNECEAEYEVVDAAKEQL